MKRTESGPLSFGDFVPGHFLPKKNKIYQEPRTADDYEAQWQTWAQVAQEYGVISVHFGGYMMMVQKQLMCGTPCDQELKRLHNRPDKMSYDAVQMRAKLAASYKIHLMPFDEDIVPILRRLFSGLCGDAQLRHAIAYFKIAAHTDRITFPGRTMPIMVIYPHASKDAAQNVLNRVYDLFKDIQGKDIVPRYNERVTSLIYFAQGDGDYKHDSFQEYYEPNRVYYRADFEGADRDYHLVNPGKEEPTKKGVLCFI